VYRETKSSNFESNQLQSCDSGLWEGVGVAKTLILLVRILGLAAIVLGCLLWITGSPYRLTYLGPHIGTGFCVAAVVFVMAVLGLIRGALTPGCIGLVLALLLPVAGFMQLPLRFHSLGVIQVVHIAIALSIIGVAERLYAAIRQAP
jgi:hypothetical protein